MGKPPVPLFQSKLLCFSLLYLFTALFLALYTSLSPTRCLLRSSPFDPLQTPLFSYPPAYGEHKYALPTARPSCSSPVLFSDYLEAVREIGDLCANSSWSSTASPLPPLRYKQGRDDNFGGKFTARERFSYFDHRNDSVEVPCGFFKEFPISSDDREAMEKCDGVVVASAVFNDHDKIRQPRGLGSQTLASVCFFMFVDDATAKVLESHSLISRSSGAVRKVGAWRVVEVAGERLYEDPAMNGVIPKHLAHRLFPNSKFSVWIDAKLQMAVDPVLLVHSLLVREGADMAVSRHPYFKHTMEEAMATARWKKWRDVDSLQKQMETYCENGLQPWSHNKLPYTSDVPDSALILRRHTPASNLFSCLLFNELDAFNPRDQLAFAYVRDLMSPKPNLHMFDVEVFEQVALEFRHNLKRGGGGAGGPRRTKRAGSPESSGNGSFGGRCRKYLEEMWG
ncbi:probable hexosyltransferase MUCI70 [Rhodamnia argentea]|uniref:Probable hexosyltransferase MUCI70 n=1 Tax=Rhodamnia argentea TaxID=178133 RepID=A0A8B8R551_9MYRT|nr:probable hexosyltransferase MUCI70 [Rhodamnia argentea]